MIVGGHCIIIYLSVNDVIRVDEGMLNPGITAQIIRYAVPCVRYTAQATVIIHQIKLSRGSPCHFKRSKQKVRAVRISNGLLIQELRICTAIDNISLKIFFFRNRIHRGFRNIIPIECHFLIAGGNGHMGFGRWLCELIIPLVNALSCHRVQCKVFIILSNQQCDGKSPGFSSRQINRP